VLALRGSRALFAVLLSVLILAVPKCFLGDWMAGWATVRDHATSRAGADYLRWRRAGCEADDGSSGMDGEDINFKSEGQDM
jgi:hypothetical protein